MSVLGYLRPLLPSRKDYTQVRTTWRPDLLAGITVGIVALPLALAFGVTSGVGAEAGLITAIVAGLVAAIFGGSNIQVSGPTGAMVVVLVPIVAEHGVGAVATVSVLAGIIVLAMGLLKLGRLITVIPWPVIEGFTLGIACILFFQQIPTILGVTEFQGKDHSTNALVAAFESVGLADPSTLWWALGCTLLVAIIMVGLQLWKPQLPNSIIAIIVVTLGAWGLGLAGIVVPIAVIGELPSSLPAPALPALDGPLVVSLLLPAVSVAALAAIESLLAARVGATMADTGRYLPDRELVGQGLASIAAGLFGGMPSTGAIARTAVNVRSGARTRLSAIMHALVLLAVVYLAANVVSQIPLAALAGVLVVTAFRMVSLRAARAVLGASRSDALIFLATAFITVAFDLVIAVVVGVVCAAIAVLLTIARSGTAVAESLPGEVVEGDERIAMYRLEGPLFFMAAESVVAEVEQVRDVEVVIVRMSGIRALDATGARTITELVQGLERRGVTVLLKGIPERHLQIAQRAGVLASLRHQKHLFDDLDAAVAHARDHVRRARIARESAAGD